jgi:CheY-like chemotaxis protein
VATLRRRARDLAEADQSPPAAPVSQRRALVVDNSSTVRLLATMQLSDVGYAVTALSDGRQALAEALATPYDLLVTSVETPGLGGLELVTALRATTARRGLPVILTSSTEEPEHQRRAAALGVVAYLPKGSLSDTRLAATARRVAAEQQPTSAEPASPPSCTARQRVLLVEDSPLQQRVLVDLLDALGYTADVVGTGREALRALATAQYETVLMDCQLPELDGFETSREIRRRQAGTRYTPIIAMTADDDVAIRDRCFAAGMDDHLAKPVQKDELAARLGCWKRRDGQAMSRRAGENSPACVDTQPLQSMRALVPPGQPDPVAPLIGVFLSETRARLADCRQGVERTEPHVLAAAAHALKGNSGTFGALEMRRLALELERRAREGSVAGTAELLSALYTEFVQVAATLEAFVMGQAKGDGCDS